MDTPKYLTSYHPPEPENVQDLEQLELLFKKIEVLVRERYPQPSTARQHVLMRLMEAELMTKELIKGTFEEEARPRKTKGGSYIIE